MREMNAWVGDRTRKDTTAALRVHSENESASLLNRRLCVGYTYLKDKYTHKYTKVARVRDGLNLRT